VVKLVNLWACISLWVTANKSRSPNLQAARGDFAALCDGVWNGQERGYWAIILIPAHMLGGKM